MRPTHALLWSRTHNDGQRLCQDGRFADAEASFTAALGHARAAGIADARLASTLYQLAVLADRRGRRAEALDLYRRALETEERALGVDHPYVAMVLRGYASLLRRAGRVGQAAALDARADAIWGEPSGWAISGESTEARVA